MVDVRIMFIQDIGKDRFWVLSINDSEQKDEVM